MSHESEITQELLSAENEGLRARLSEAEEALRAIRSGTVDALTVQGEHGEQLFTLAGAERPYRVLIEQMNEGALTMTAKGVIVYANHRLAEILRSPLDTLIGSDLHAWIPPASQQILQSLLQRSASESRHEDLPLIASDGTLIPAYVSVNSLPPTDETLAAFCMVVTDLTDRKHSEEIASAVITAQELLAASNQSRLTLLSVIEDQKLTETARNESEERYQLLVDRLPDGVVVHIDGRVVFANPACARMMGAVSPVDLIGKSVIEFLLPGNRDRALDRINRSFAEGTPSPVLEETLIRLDGSPVEVTVSAVRLMYGGKPAVLSVFNDITERKRAESALELSELQYRQFFEDDLTGDYESTPDGTVIKCNTAFARMFGFASVAEALRSSARTLYPDSKSRGVFLQLLNEKKKLEYHETELFRHDGTPVYCVQNAIGIFDEQGKLVRVRGYLFDDSRRKTLERQLLQAQKLESLGTLASGIAHDFNNILGIILAYSSLLESLPENPALVTKNSAAIARAVQRGSDLVKQMLTFARKSDLLVVPVPLNDIIQEVKTLLSETLPKSIEVILHLKKSLPSIEADVTQVHQVLINLCVNARDAMPDGGVLTISSRLVPLKDVEAVSGNATAQEYVELSVSDTGSGMDEETQRRIFEPFYTTKVRGKGTGLGLSLVYGIMESHKGVVTVRSTPGVGSTFHCYFPVPSASAEVVLDEVQPLGKPPGGSETILFVEDEESLRRPITDLLELNGYGVIAASDGEEALAVYQLQKDAIQLIISDLDLPKLSGDTLFHKVRELNAHIPFILASGFFEPGLKIRILKAGVSDLLQKPYNSAVVLRSIRKALDAGTPGQIIP